MNLRWSQLHLILRGKSSTASHLNFVRSTKYHTERIRHFECHLSDRPKRLFEKSRFEKFNARTIKMGKKGKKADKKGENNVPAPKIPSYISLVPIGTGGPGTSQCLLLTTEASRYMFNCGEGTQRLILMNKTIRAAAFAKLGGLENVFITHKSWDNVGGLLGLAMHIETQTNPDNHIMNKQATSADKPASSNPELSLYGPEGIEKITMMAKKFSEQLFINIVRKTDDFEDSAFKISPLIFHKKCWNENKDEIRAGPPSPKRRRSNSFSQSEQPTSSHEEVYGYICFAKPPRPKINVEKCFDAGVTIGPMVGQLQNGLSVTLDDGTVVHPSQVTDLPETLSKPFLVIDCPEESYFPSIEDCVALKKYRTDARGEASDSLCIVVHMTSSTILNTPYYKKWMEGFGSSTDHLIMNEDAKPADPLRMRSYQAHLNIVHSQIFPLLPEISSGSQFGDNNSTEAVLGNIRKACTGLIYTIRGKEVGFHMETDDLDLPTLQQELMKNPDVDEEVEKLKSIISLSDNGTTMHEVKHETSQYPQVTFLGTGSSTPSLNRGQSCILIHTSENSSFILDCGEEAYGQLFRFYGPSNTSNVLMTVKAIFISHLHGDHHLGLFTLLQQRKKAFDEHEIPFTPAIVVAPLQMRRWLRFYQNELGEISQLFKLFHHQKSLPITDNASFCLVSEEALLHEVGLSQYSAVEVIHCRNAFGFVLTLNDGFKIVYSGDTRPCQQLALEGKDCDLLIHEATHDDDRVHLAKITKHSTFSEAMEIGTKMEAKQIILTHFSQRYTHMVPLFETSLPPNVGIAFDNMQVTPKNMPILSTFIPLLTNIFDEKLKKFKIRKSDKL